MEGLTGRIVDYWAERAPSFLELRMKEFQSDMHDKWLAEFTRYMPADRKLRILDLGTGTGFFAFLLAAQGHDVVGIDLTAEMISEAIDWEAELGTGARFMVMDAEEPDFPDECFDVLVTRNLTWTLPHLRKAYDAWFDLLVPGGVLINFDADYGRAVMEDTEAELPSNHAHKGISPTLTEENNAITLEVYSYQQPRPQWDVQLLLGSGFERIMVDAGVWERIYTEIDEFYNPVPIFTIAAYKGGGR